MGAFSSKGEAAAIAPVQLKGGFTPSDGVAGVVQDLVGIASPIIRQETLKGIKEEVGQSADSIRIALEMAANPVLAESRFSEEALKNPVTQAAFEEFQLINLAATDGKLPASYARERLIVVQNQAIADAPAFEKEIRQMYGAATGIDAEADYFRNLLDQTAPPATPEEKALAQNRKEAALVGYDLGDYMGMKNKAKTQEFLMQDFAFAKAKGNYDGKMLVKEVELTAGLILADMIKGARLHKEAGGVYDDEFKLQQTNMVKTLHIASRQRLIATMPAHMDSSDVKAALQQQQDMSDMHLSMIEDNTIGTIAKNDTLTKKLMMENSIYNSKIALPYHLTKGGAAFVPLLDLLSRSEAAQQTFSKLDPNARAFKIIQAAQITTDAGMKALGEMGNGVKPNTTEEHNAKVQVAVKYLGAPDQTEETRQKALKDLVMLDPEFAFVSYGTRDVLNRLPQSNFLKASFLNLHGDNVAKLAADYKSLSNGVDREQFKIENDLLVYKGGDPTIPDDNEATDEGIALAARFNRTNMVSRKTRDIGVLPESKYTTTERLWDTVVDKQELTPEQQAAVTEAQKPKVSWGYDKVTGKLVEVGK